MILVLDNYDSFVFNLDRYLRRLGQRTLVVRSDAIHVDGIARLDVEATTQVAVWKWSGVWGIAFRS
jgi:anthranilate/para-aminobenzoate synthase component II